MWEDLKVYRPLNKKDISPTFKKLGLELQRRLTDFTVEQTNSIIKISRLRNGIEQGIFIEKHIGPADLQVRVSLKPIDFYKRHRFTMLNIVRLGDIMGQYRRTFYPVTQEWLELADYLKRRVENEMESYFKEFDTFDKIIKQRTKIEPRDFGLNNKYELLIYAAIKTGNSKLLSQYIDKKLERPTMHISKAEYLKPKKDEISEVEFLTKIKELGQLNRFEDIGEMLKRFEKK
jgi:hypothetical protein